MDDDEERDDLADWSALVGSTIDPTTSGSTDEEEESW